MDIWEASREGNIPRVRKLLDEGTDVNSVNSNGYTPLMRAAQFNAIDMINFLLDQGANINQKTTGLGNTALTLAIYNSNGTSSIDAVKLLLDRGAEIFVINSEGSDAVKFCPSRECMFLISGYM